MTVERMNTHSIDAWLHFLRSHDRYAVAKMLLDVIKLPGVGDKRAALLVVTAMSAYAIHAAELGQLALQQGYRPGAKS
jgi:endonuclease III